MGIRKGLAGASLGGYFLTSERTFPIINSVREATLFGGDLVSVGFILFLAFLLFGPKKLPDIARALGKGMGELRRASYELRNAFEEEIRNLDRPSDGASDSPPYYGHNYREPTREEPESRP